MRGAIVLLAGLVLASGAEAAPPAVTATALPPTGNAPLQVILTATGEAATYSWEPGDGSFASGPLVTHTYAAGRFVATVTPTSAGGGGGGGGGGEHGQAQVAVTAVERLLTLEAPRAGGYGARVLLAGSLLPARAGSLVQICRGRTYVTTARVGGDGRFRAVVLLRSPGPYHARSGSLRSATRAILVEPTLEASLAPAIAVGPRIVLRSRVVPAAAGTLATRVLRGKRLISTGRERIRLPTRVAGPLRIEVFVRPRAGYRSVRTLLRTAVVHPALSLGARGPSVLALERRLADRASHGCVRIPMWLAPALFSSYGYRTTVFVH